jgi:nucleoid-associated protein YgaU
MRRALSDELDDNLKDAQKWTTYFIEGDAWRFEGRVEDYPLQTYVWDSMKTASDVSFELPPKVLTDIRRYYRNTQLYVRDMVGRSGASRPAAEALRKETARMRKEIQPLLAKDTKDYAARLVGRGVKVD